MMYYRIVFPKHIILLTVTLINSIKKKRGGKSPVPPALSVQYGNESSGLLPLSKEAGDTLRAVTPQRKIYWKQISVTGNNFQSGGSLN